MIHYEPPYVVHMIERRRGGEMAGESGIVYSSGNPEDAEAFASSLYETGATVVEVRDSTGQLVRRFPAA
jgi:hypothetical protein